ncbi:galanin receptor type 1-like [Montipora capricornis]|uniref:galanin receptor type 1-like n=1 Tax=Montipora capricornis TaxID=246305 RepID=UPI0035F170A9
MFRSSQNVTALPSIANFSISKEEFDRLAIVQLMCFPIITAAGLVGNILICFAVCKRQRLRITDIFILNLAATDLGTCVISIPFDFVEILTKQWPFGNVLCKIVYPLQTILMAVSVYTLLFMSWERHRSVMPPFKPKWKTTRAMAIVLFLWMASICLVGPYIAILRVETDTSGKAHCNEKWPKTYHPKVFTLVVFIALYVLPLFVITANYIKISQKLWRDIQRMKKAIEGDNKGIVKKPLTQARAQRNMRIVKIFVIVVIVFALCMLPIHVMWIWYDFGSGSDFQTSFDTIIIFCNILVYTNSAINPFIFVFLHRHYCKDILSSCDPLKVLASCFRDNSTNGTLKREKSRLQRKQAHRTKKRATAGVSPLNHSAIRREFWNDYWRKEIMPKHEARRFHRVFELSRLGQVANSRLYQEPEDDYNKNNNDEKSAPTQAAGHGTRRLRVNFGEIVHIDEQRILQPEGEECEM